MNNRKTYNELISEGYRLIFAGYDELSNWVVLEREGKQFYYYLSDNILIEIKNGTPTDKGQKDS